MSTDGFSSSDAYRSTFSNDTTYDAVGRRSSELTIDYDSDGYYSGSDEVWFNHEGRNTMVIRSSSG